jgi:hypothetical protein
MPKLIQNDLDYLVQTGVLNFPYRQMKLLDNAISRQLAMDAQTTPITVSNGGIPAFLTNYVDPSLIEILVAPMKAVDIIGQEVKKGDWTTMTAFFETVESTGETSSYGDFSNDGVSGVNINWPQRQSYHYQVITQWGERQLEMAALGRVDYAARLNVASVLTLNKFQNQSYFFGVSNLQNYGLLNDPSLYAAISPTTKAAGHSNVWIYNGAPNATGMEVLTDIQAMFYQLQSQANGTVDLNSKLTLAMSPTSEVALTFTNQYNVNVSDLLKKNFPNLTVKTAPEYATVSGQLVQLIADEVEGQKTVDAAFTEKLRAHPVFVDLSSWRQKKSQGTWGAIVYRPVMIAQMLGV